MAAKNPQVNCFSTAGDSHSIVLNQLRERGLAAASGAAMMWVILNGRLLLMKFHWKMQLLPIPAST
jgi:hypothetical protein